MVIRPRWFIEGFENVIIETYVFSVIIFVLSLASNLLPWISLYAPIIYSMISMLTISASLFYLIRVLTKKSWIVKEAIYSLGLLAAGLAVGDLITVAIASMAIIIVVMRKTI